MCIVNPKKIKSKRKYAYKVLVVTKHSLSEDNIILSTPFFHQKIYKNKWNKANIKEVLYSVNSNSRLHKNKLSVLLKKPFNYSLEKREKLFKVEIRYKKLITGYCNAYDKTSALVDSFRIVKEVKPLKLI